MNYSDIVIKEHRYYATVKDDKTTRRLRKWHYTKKAARKYSFAVVLRWDSLYATDQSLRHIARETRRTEKKFKFPDHRYEPLDSFPGLSRYIHTGKAEGIDNQGEQE